jgi:hypothetical protein
VDNLKRAPPREFTEEIGGIDRCNNAPTAPDEFVRRRAVLKNLAVEIHQVKHWSGRVLECVQRIDARVQSGLTRHNRPDVLDPLADGWNRPAVAQRVSGEVESPNHALTFRPEVFGCLLSGAVGAFQTFADFAGCHGFTSLNAVFTTSLNFARWASLAEALAEAQAESQAAFQAVALAAV